MQYNHVFPAVFLDRPNRFVARVELNNMIETVHVKNTGRCRELLLPGAEAWLTSSDNPARKTRYDLIAVRKADGRLVNIDSQAPNKVAWEWLDRQEFSRIVPEYRFGESRLDFFMERGPERFLMEVKGCTLEADGIGYFPDAPTQRGVKHRHELAKAAREGYKATLAFVIQMDGVRQVLPNLATHPEFGAALDEARCSGVKVLFLTCRVQPDRLTASDAIWEA